ncbi:hypothetical protein PMAYCL1PPCAC_08467, partial [Pristionchus mayeri]
EIWNWQNLAMEYSPPWGAGSVSIGAFAYMSNGDILFVIDLVEMKINQLNLRDVSNFHIAGIREGTIIGKGRSKITGKYHIMTAVLPQEYDVQTMTVT